MTAAAARYGENGRTNSASRFVVFVTALAFALQSFIAQTHIHGAPQDIGGLIKSASTQAPAQDKSPLDHSRSDCPFCQAIAHAGAYLVPAASILVLSAWTRCETPFVAARAIAVAAAHNWQSRAPPLR
jgi:hypothetical protein